MARKAATFPSRRVHEADHVPLKEVHDHFHPHFQLIDPVCPAPALKRPVNDKRLFVELFYALA